MYDDPSSSAELRYETTVAKIEHLSRHGYEIIEKWECDFRREMSCDKEIKDYVRHHPMLTSLPLNPRDAFYGGRTGAAKMYHKIQNGEQIKYVDVCSLYPWVNKYGKYPIN